MEGYYEERVKKLEAENKELKKELTANSWERAERLGYLQGCH